MIPGNQFVIRKFFLSNKTAIVSAPVAQQEIRLGKCSPEIAQKCGKIGGFLVITEEGCFDYFRGMRESRSGIREDYALSRG